MPIYVIGHRNPDTDAICAALGYADFLRRAKEMDTVPACCGPINVRTKFVLDRAQIDPPMLLMDVSPTVGKICERNVLYAREAEPFLEVYRRMQHHRLRMIPVVNSEDELIGLLPLLNLLQLVLPHEEDIGESRYVESSLTRIRNTLGATFQNEVDIDDEEKLVMMIGAMRASSFVERMHKYAPDQLLVISGDRPSVYQPAIEYGVRAIIISGGYLMDEELLTQARTKGVAVLSSPFDTAMTAMLVKSARLIHHALEKDFVTFSENVRVVDVRERVANLDQDLFPVMDDGKMIGVFSKSDLVRPKKEKLILVDHNEYGQAVSGAKGAEILEVLDHHRLGGGLVSREPIRFVNEVVGSTSTLISRMYREHAMIPARDIALCLASGIISDTLNLSSPTTTQLDRDILAWLEPHAGTNLNDFAQEFFAAGSVLVQTTCKEVLQNDCKRYEENGWTMSVSQVEELGMNRFYERKDDLTEAMASFAEDKGVDFTCLMVTNINVHSSVLLVYGDERLIDAIKYPHLEDDLFDLKGVVSRKKQLLPHLMHIASELDR